jgi:hypothetical protein
MFLHICFLLLLAGYCQSTNSIINPKLTVGIVGDLTGTYNYARSLELLDNATDLFHDSNIHHIIQLGDSIETNNGNIPNQVQVVNSYFASKNLTWYPTAGYDI